MKGQNAVFEQVLLFGISVAIFVMAFAVFNVYQTHFSSVASVDHIKAVKDIVYASVIEMMRVDGINSSAKISIPKTINGEGYEVSLNNTAITVRTYDSGISASSSTAFMGGEGADTYGFSGSVSSSRGEIIIYKRGSNIILG
ncbi:MAG: hypothetical protein J7K54_03230 [Candidatus Aenigmarchaeota archaeon]|nr:hypothetical protein [Candidatus Aenigmarchaeota archaeon]